jgi:hypothetical protein
MQPEWLADAGSSAWWQTRHDSDFDEAGEHAVTVIISKTAGKHLSKDATISKYMRNTPHGRFAHNRCQVNYLSYNINSSCFDAGF